ncbi:hypothetical protein GCM10010124_32990 [Pilimelia terevasa]|uniref:Uncharacterized protein n=1 Tax=Pilimelia terevasa TaxID=53372 RepID=A0A8J3BTB6_9ACTN|nr:glycosyltransferase family 39 protein [Pilimelia terevasa]GGK37588.1 hypothetical protein GCM10010124_32990 [Pilimelia terevasa]
MTTVVTEAPAVAGPPARPAPPAAPAPLGRRRHRADRPLLLGLTALTALVHGVNLGGGPVFGADEGTYLAQAWAVREGVGLAHYTYWYDHPPFGWMQLAALGWLPDLALSARPSLVAGRVAMMVFALASTVLVYLLARRLRLPPWAAATAVALFVLSPLELALHRQVYLDNIAVTWLLGALLLALSRRRHLWHYIAAGGCAAGAVLSKETVVLAVPAVALAIWQRSHRSTRAFCLTGFVAAFVLTLSVYPLYAALNGELMPGGGHVSLLGAWFHQVAGRHSSGNVLDAGSDAYRTVDAWLYQDPVVVLAGAAAALLALGVRRLRVPAVAATVMSLIALRPGGYLPAMYVTQVLPFFALCLAGLAHTATVLFRRGTWAPPRLRRPVRAAALVLAAALAAGVGASWYDGNRRLWREDANAGYVTAGRWVREHVRPAQTPRIVVDDALWPDMVRAGFAPGTGAIWFYKLDLDPAVMAHLPGGWRDLHYVVVTPMMRQRPDGLPTLTEAITHSEVVAAFGAGAERIEVRRVLTELREATP